MRRSHLSAGVLDRAGHRPEGEGVAEDLLAGLQARAFEHEHDGAPAGIERHAVLVSRVPGEFRLALGHHGGGGVLNVVAVHSSRGHKGHGLVDSGLGDGIGGFDVPGNYGADGVGRERISTVDDEE